MEVPKSESFVHVRSFTVCTYKFHAGIQIGCSCSTKYF